MEERWNRADAMEEDRQLCHCFLIGTDSTWKPIFDIIILLLVGYTCFLNMYMVSFPSTLSQPQELVNRIVEYLFILDFVMNFFQCYKETDTQDVITDHKKIAVKYIKGWFVIDAISIFPFDLILTDPSQSSAAKLVRLARLPRLVKLFDI